MSRQWDVWRSDEERDDARHIMASCATEAVEVAASSDESDEPCTGVFREYSVAPAKSDVVERFLVTVEYETTFYVSKATP